LSLAVYPVGVTKLLALLMKKSSITL